MEEAARRLSRLHDRFVILLGWDRFSIDVDCVTLIDDVHPVIGVDRLWRNRGISHHRIPSRCAPPPPRIERVIARPVTAPAPVTPPRIIKDVIVKVLGVVPNLFRAVGPVIPKIFAVLLPILASLVAPFLAIFARALQLVPAFVAIVLEIVATLFALFGAFVPRFAAIVDSIAPLIITVLRPLTPIRPLFWPGPRLARAWSVGWQLTWTIPE